MVLPTVHCVFPYQWTATSKLPTGWLNEDMSFSAILDCVKTTKLTITVVLSHFIFGDFTHVRCTTFCMHTNIFHGCWEGSLLGKIAWFESMWTFLQLCNANVKRGHACLPSQHCRSMNKGHLGAFWLPALLQVQWKTLYQDYDRAW